MSKELQVFFEEKQSLPAFFRLGLPVALATIVIAVYFFDSNADFSLIDLAILATLVLPAIGFGISCTHSTLITKVDEKKVSIRRRFVIHAEMPLEQISKAEAMSYNDAYKICDGQFSLWASGFYFFIGNMGVVIHHMETMETKLTFVSSKRAEELAAAINDAREKFEQAKYM